MSDQAARDRVIERIAESIDWQPTCLPGNERRTIVRQVLDMAEHPRALAGAPTADVADFLRWLVAMDESSGAIAREARRTVTLTQIIDRARALLAAAPEGAPTADVADELAEWREYDDAMRERCLETMDPDLIEATLKNLASNLYRLRTRLAAPEGVDAADELRIAREQYSSTLAELERVHDSREQVYGERDEACTQRTAAQGELHRRNVEAKSATIRAAGLADELTAAQAAIQRVRTVATETLRYCRKAGVPESVANLHPSRVLRALDGDTTEGA